jgi:hypothetical protein
MTTAGDETQTGNAPLSVWARKQGIKLVSGDPARTIKKLNPASVVRYVKQLVQNSKGEKQRHQHSEWSANVFFTYGQQHIERDTRGRWHPIPLSEDELHTTNVILPKVFQIVSKYVGGKPTWSVVPRDTSPQDSDRARTAEKLLRALHDHGDMLPRRVFLTLCQIILGDAFMKLYFDETAGPISRAQEPITHPDGSPVIDPETNEPAMADGGYEAAGDLEQLEVSPYYMHVPPGTPSPLMEDCDYVIEEVPTSLKTLWRRWRYDARPDATQEDPMYQMLSDYSRIVGATDGGFRDTRPRDLAYQWQYHELASLVDGFEEGIIVTIVNDDVVDVRPQQLPHECGYPYVHYAAMPMLNRFWSHSIVTEMRSPQRLWNKDRLRLSQNRDLTAIPWIWDPVGSGLPQGALTSGNRVLKGHQEPKFLPTPALSQALIADSQENLADVDRVANMYGPSRGELPGKSPMSTGALEVLKESESSALQPQIALAVHAYSAQGRKALELIRRFMPAPRLYALAGASAQIEGFVAGGDQIPQEYLVQVQEDSALHQLKSAMRQELMMAIQMGLYGPLEDPQRLQYMRDQLRFPTPTDLTPNEVLDRRNAIAEASRFVNEGQPPMASPLEDHAVHLMEHVRVTKTPEYRQWPEKARMIWVQHIQQTEALIQAQQAAAREQGFGVALEQAAIEAIGRGKFRDAEAMLLSMKGIMERIQLQLQSAQQQAQQGPAAQPAAAQPQPGG